jgi:ribosomal protein L11 methyltransferase
MRLWPAIDILVPPVPDHQREELQGRLLAALDEGLVTAVQERPDGWRFFLATPDARDRALGVLTAAGALSATAVDISDEDWARRSQESLGPVHVGRVTITPPWSRQASPAGVEVVIQPSMGFGTGHHATTRLCTQLLQRLDCTNRHVLDVGTGSGVLAIVALRLGAASVLAIDDDPDALESARENLDLNGITSGIELRRTDFRDLAGRPFDVVTANLTGGLLVKGAEVIVSAVAPGGHLVLSGITAEEEDEVRHSYESRLALQEVIGEDGWVALLLHSARA